MTRPFDICPECGADPFKTQDYDKIVSEKRELDSRFKRALADNGLRRAEWTVREITLEESMKWLQRKVKKQAQAIQRLEDKLKRRGERPYKEDNPETLMIKSLDGSFQEVEY